MLSGGLYTVKALSAHVSVLRPNLFVVVKIYKETI
jgi:hypothetical protein